MRKMRGAMPARDMNPMPAAVGKGKKGSSIGKGGGGTAGMTGFRQHLSGAVMKGGKSIKCP